MTLRLDRDAVEAVAAATGEPGWLAERRLEAFDLFEKLDIPKELAAKGVVFTDLVNADPELVREHFFTEVPVDEHRFTALHGAFHSDDVLVYVPRGVDVDVPLEVLRDVDKGGSTFPHTTIVVEEQASLTFVDRFKSDDRSSRRVAEGQTDSAMPSMCSSAVEV